MIWNTKLVLDEAEWYYTALLYSLMINSVDPFILLYAITHCLSNQIVSMHIWLASLIGQHCTEGRLLLDMQLECFKFLLLLLIIKVECFKFLLLLLLSFHWMGLIFAAAILKWVKSHARRNSSEEKCRNVIWPHFMIDYDCGTFS